MTDTSSSTGAKTGTIHDIGYKRYVGNRRPTSTRWLVIMRHQIAMGWKKWWRYKLSLFFAVVASFVAGGIMYFLTNKLVRSVGARGGDILLTIGDSVVPMSIEWYCRAAFILTLTLGATIVASDTQSGAFTFYYVRSIRPIDYVLGKLAGFGILVATLLIVPPLLLCALRLGLSENLDEVIAHLHIVPKVIAIGLLATLVYTAVPLAVSSLVANRRSALALWVAYYFVIGLIAGNISRFAAANAGVFDIQTSLQAVTYELFDIKVMRIRTGGLPAHIALIGLLAQGAAAIALLWYQVSRDQRHGVGGSS